jgi:fructose-bisphosphate aldolase class II
MPLVDMQAMLSHAYRHRYAVGAFDLVSLDFLEGIMTAVEARRAPVILSLAESHFEYYDFALAMAATETAARRATVPVAIHLDHGASLESAGRAINLGCNGVMVDASTLPFDANVATTRAVADMAHACGVPVEGELGYVAGVEGEDAEKHPGEVVYTSVDEARTYVEATGVDFLAVSIGTVHGRMRGAPRLDFERLARINESLGIPLVIHGGTGLSDDQYRRLIGHGVAKINYYTALADAAAARMRDNAARDDRAGYTGLMKGVRAAIQAEVERMIGLFGCGGQADAVLAVARRFDPVEHVIEYNVHGADDAAVAAMMARGREVLAKIPGVRRVVTGQAVGEKPKFRFCWLVEFAHERVIASYRDHPVHRAFADEVFRPLAGDRLSIDFVAIRQAPTHDGP